MAADSSLRYLAIANMIEGCIVVLLQVNKTRVLIIGISISF